MNDRAEVARRETRTFALDSLRGFGDGVVQALEKSVLLLVAVQLYATPDSLKALIAAAPFIGNVLSLFYSASFSASSFSKAKLAALPLFLAAVAFAIAAVQDSGVWFAVVASLGVVCFTLRQSFLAAIYHENYEASRLGVLFSRGLLLSISSGLLASFFFGKLLDRSLDYHHWILFAAALAAVLSGSAVATMPASPPKALNRKNPLANLTLVTKNRAFGYILFVWFIFGFANLWVLPLRIVYLAEAERGLGFSPWKVVLLHSVLMESARLVFTPLWAKLFDRMNFVALRMVLNGFLGTGLLLFFATENPWVIGIGSVLSGIGMAGGGIAWNLWVTRFAPARETHVYMSVHTFFTGVRGVLGPYLGFWAFSSLGLHAISWISAFLIAFSTVLLLPAVRWGRRGAGLPAPEIIEP